MITTEQFIKSHRKHEINLLVLPSNSDLKTMIIPTKPLFMGANVTIITKTKGIRFNATNINGLLQKIPKTKFDILDKEKYKHNVFFMPYLEKRRNNKNCKYISSM